MSDGAYKTIDELRSELALNKYSPKPNIDSLDEDFKFVSKGGYGIENNGVKEVFRLTTRTGRMIDLTTEHPLFVFRSNRPEWIPLGNIQLGDRIAVPSTGSFGVGCAYSDSELKFLGYIIGGGGVKDLNGGVRWSSANKIHIEEMAAVSKELGTKMKKVSRTKCCFRFVSVPRGEPHKINEFVKKVGLSGRGSHDKFVPREVFRGTKRQVSIFLNRLFATDGWACTSDNYKGRAEIGYCSVSLELAKDVHSLLLKFGIIASLSEKRVRYNGDICIAYQIVMNAAADIKTFAKKIGIFGKETAIEKAVAALKDRRIVHNRKIDAIPVGVMRYIDAKRRSLGIAKNQVVGDLARNAPRTRTTNAPSRRRLKKYAKNLGGDRFLESLADSEVVWDPVVDIVSLGKHQTHDLSDVDGTQNFVADEVVVHNSTCLCIKALHYAFTHANSKVVIMAPYDEQVRRLFHDTPGMGFMIQESATLQSSVVGRVTLSPPYRIKFNNGSEIVGNTAGTKSGAGGGATRGKPGDLILLDEADYLDDTDLRMVMGIRIGNPYVSVIASSTPSGRRGLWYKWNHDSMWSSHHFPSTVVPYWNMIMDTDVDGNPVTFGQEILCGFDEYGIITEVLAHFPEELAGVFQKYYIDVMFGDKEVLEELKIKDQSSYKYGDRPPNLRTNKRVMGVDVDKYANGPEGVILEWDEKLEKMVVLYRFSIPRGNKGELTLHALVDRIIQEDIRWKTSFIYVDRGYGEMVLESLHKYGRDHPKSMLDVRVKPIFFGSRVEIPDPARRGKKTKVPLKPYAVNLLARCTERIQIVASRYDTKLKRQMENYQIVASSATTGQPRYTSKNEHVLDALMYALYGMTEMFGSELKHGVGGRSRIIRPGDTYTGDFGTYMDPSKEIILPKQDPRKDPTVLQINDIPPAGRINRIRSRAQRSSRSNRPPSRAMRGSGRGLYRGIR